MSETPFYFCSPEGITLCRQILTQYLPFCPHDYQLEGTAMLLDEQDFIAISATGSGKTGYIYMSLLIVKALKKDPTLCPGAKFPDDPVTLVILPTTALEETQPDLKCLGEADEAGKHIWQEMLVTPGFESLVKSKKFQAQLLAIGIDKVHLLASWGKDFRPKFRQIAFIRSQFRRRVPLFGMTATLRKGLPMQLVLDLLGFHEGNFHLLRRSNACPDIQIIYRTLETSLGKSFPQLDWILEESGKVLIFCPTIHHGFRLAVYFWHIDPRGAVLKKNIHLFNSLNSASYNTETLKLLEGDSTSRITIATDKLSVGVDVSDFQLVVILDPKDLDDLWQKAGRVGRDQAKIKNAHTVIYFPSAKLSMQEWRTRVTGHSLGAPHNI
ncbi:P-loop containing nucleoside triphosphate hydrolase protein [Crepidotus variabilis]|uniref:DNA 3'-5' helicase n=1 Tax=Crepidotus variabilis TaxID=179855 RepID=A0A9P6E3Z5_9AGAR|nr:P-loop containing nucleoside triphosphate hydrolase protein [Crepidotus variabilis]